MSQSTNFGLGIVGTDIIRVGKDGASRLPEQKRIARFVR